MDPASTTSVPAASGPPSYFRLLFLSTELYTQCNRNTFLFLVVESPRQDHRTTFMPIHWVSAIIGTLLTADRARPSTASVSFRYSYGVSCQRGVLELCTPVDYATLINRGGVLIPPPVQLLYHVRCFSDNNYGVHYSNFVKVRIILLGKHPLWHFSD